MLKPHHMMFVAVILNCGCERAQPRSVSDAGVVVSIGLSEKRHSVNDYYAKHVDRIAPAIDFVSKHLQQHDSLPSQKTFQDWADQSGAHMLVIWDRDNKYAAQHGAADENDFMIGTWMSEWYFYYKSWDHEYINASDEILTGFMID